MIAPLWLIGIALSVSALLRAADFVFNLVWARRAKLIEDEQRELQREQREQDARARELQEQWMQMQGASKEASSRLVHVFEQAAKAQGVPVGPELQVAEVHDLSGPPTPDANDPDHDEG